MDRRHTLRHGPLGKLVKVPWGWTRADILPVLNCDANPFVRNLDGHAAPYRPCLALHDGKVCISGYPNTVMLAYDPARPWTTDKKSESKGPNNNPRCPRPP